MVLFGNSTFSIQLIYNIESWEQKLRCFRLICLIFAKAHFCVT